MNKISVPLLSLFLLASCGGGGGGGNSGGGGGGNNQTSNSSIASQSSISSSATSSADANIQRYTETDFKPGHWGNTFSGTFSGLSIDGLDFYNSDGTYGTTAPGFQGSRYSGRENATIHFHLGSIEFYSMPSSNLISIFDLLRTHNQKSNEVQNLVRLLMLLDDNNSSSNQIAISAQSKKQITQAQLSLQDLFVDINEFQNLNQIKTLITSVGKKTLPSPQEADVYLNKHFSKWIGISGYAQWPKGRDIDFDADGVLNESDDFPWDSAQSKDANGDRKGDSPQVQNEFLETRGVKSYAIDSLNNFLYVADYHKKLSRYDLISGKFLMEILLPEYVTSMDVNKDNGELYIATASSYVTDGTYTSDNINGHISTLQPTSSKIEQEQITLNTYPFSIQRISKNRLVVSGLYSFGENARLIVYDASNHNLLQDIPFGGTNYGAGGTGGRIIYGDSKLLIDSSNYFVFNVGNQITYLTQGSFQNYFSFALFLDEKKDVVVDSYGFAYRLSAKESESWISDDGTLYANYGYYDSIDTWVSPLINTSIEDDANNQHLSFSKGGVIRLFYVNKTSSLVSGKKFINEYDSNGSYWQYSKSALATLANKIYIVSERTDGSTQISSFVNPCNSCGVSTPPLAEISITKPSNDIQSAITLDGATSTDAEDGNKLQYRWDLNGDGKWDTNFSTNSLYDVKYDSAGKKNIILQVMDSSGLSNEKSFSINLDYGIYTGEIPESEDLGDIHLLIDDAEFDQDQNIIYVTSSETAKMYAISAITGKVIKEFHFRYLPTQMALSKEDHMLYVGFNPTGCFGTQLFDCENDLISPNSGFVLKFDLAKQAFIGSFDVNLAPADMVVNDEQLFISAHYLFHDKPNFKNGINIYNKNTGAFIKHMNTSSGLSDSFDHILKISDQPIPSSCCANTGGFEVFNDEVNGVIVTPTDYKQAYWLLPDQQTVTNNIGSLVSLEDQSFAGRLDYNRSFGIRDAAIDAPNNIFVAGTPLNSSTPSAGVIDYYDAKSFTKLGEIPTSDWPEWIFISDEKIIYIARRGNYQYFMKFLNKPWVH